MTRKDFTELKEGDTIFLAKKGIYLEVLKLNDVDDLYVGYVLTGVFRGFEANRIPISKVAMGGGFTVRDLYKDPIYALARAAGVKEVVVVPNFVKSKEQECNE